MKYKELLLPLFLALITTWGLQYYFASNEKTPGTESVKSGERFVAPKTPSIQVHKPLNTEIDFSDSKPTRKAKLTQIDTDHVRYEFSNDGASLSRLEFKRNWAGKEGYLETIFPTTSLEKEKSAFLVAFNEETPYYFDFVEQKEEADRYLITYKADFAQGVLFKIFTIFKKLHRLDLEISLKLKEGVEGSIVPRIFFPSPLVPELIKEDVISGIVNEGSTTLKVFPKNEQTINSYWSNPTLFGTQDRYFVQAMVNDPSGFTQRGYYKAMDLDSLYSILEGPSVKQDASWNLTFYVGPKEDDAMVEVDPRLEQTLNYGWFSFISKPLSKWLLDALNLLNEYTNNYGIAIILLTILIKIVLFPFTFRAEESLKKRTEFQKKLDHIQRKYKKNPEAATQAKAELIRKHGMPGLGGCLPMFLQLPVFWALSITLSNAIELYKAPFLWIPDLSVSDPYYILPIIMGVGIIFHSPSTDAKQRIQSIFIAIFVAAIVSNLSAGLTLYIAVSTLLAIAQSFIVKQLNLA